MRRENLKLCIRVPNEYSTQELWTFHETKRITFGPGFENSVHLFAPSLSRDEPFFQKRRGELRLYIPPSLKGSLTVNQADLSFAALRENDLMKQGARGDYVSLKRHSKGHFILGEIPVKFWLSDDDDEVLFPKMPRWKHLANTLSGAYIVCLILSFTFHFSLFRFFKKLPTPPAITLQEVTQRIARISLKEKDYRKYKLEQIWKNRGTPEGKGRKKRSRRGTIQQRAVKGILSAVTTAKQGKKRSAFANLFSQNPVKGGISDSLLDESINELLSAPAIVHSSNPNRGGPEPEAVDIGDLRGESFAAGDLTQSVRGPRVATLSKELEDQAGNQFDPKTMEAFIASKSNELQDCYEQALLRKPSLAGKLVLELVLTTAGRAINIQVASRSMPDRALAACIRGKVKVWRFPKPKAQTRPIQIPFIFSRAARK